MYTNVDTHILGHDGAVLSRVKALHVLAVMVLGPFKTAATRTPSGPGSYVDSELSMGFPEGPST